MDTVSDGTPRVCVRLRALNGVCFRHPINKRGSLSQWRLINLVVGVIKLKEGNNAYLNNPAIEVNNVEEIVQFIAGLCVRVANYASILRWILQQRDQSASCYLPNSKSGTLCNFTHINDAVGPTVRNGGSVCKITLSSRVAVPEKVCCLAISIRNFVPMRAMNCIAVMLS